MQYIGMTGRTFKKQYTEHRGALGNRKTAERNPTKLSKHVWSLKDRNIQPEIQWKVRAKTGIYFPGAKFCVHMRKHSLHSTILLPRKRRKKRKKDQQQLKKERLTAIGDFSKPLSTNTFVGGDQNLNFFKYAAAFCKFWPFKIGSSGNNVYSLCLLIVTLQTCDFEEV